MSPIEYSAYDLNMLVDWFVKAEDPLHRGEQSLTASIHEHCYKLATKELSRRLNLSADGEYALLEDSVSCALENLWLVLYRARQSDTRKSVNAVALVRTLAKRALADQIRERKPDGHKLLCKLNYALDKHPKEYGIRVRTTMLGQTKYYSLVEACKSGSAARHWDRYEFLVEKLGPLRVEELELPELIRKILEWHGREMQKKEIFTCLRDLLPQVANNQVSVDDTADDPADPSSEDGYRKLECAGEIRRSLRWLWEELAQLPNEQCITVLLRMETCGLEALATEIGYEPIATVLGMTDEELAEFAEGLPLDFEEIGRRLGLDSQQARSRRARGWDRIERRYKAWRKEQGELDLMELWMRTLKKDGAEGRPVKVT